MSTVNARGTALHIALEAPYVRDPGGRIWTDEGIGPDHLQAHIATFGLVRLVVRVRDVASPRSGAQRIDESALTVAPLPYYQGLGGLLRTFPQLIAALWRESGTASSSLLLLPGPIGTLFGSCLALRGKRFAVQLGGDIDAVLRGEGLSRAARLLRWPATTATRRLCTLATDVAYVTSGDLQQKYPAAAGARAFSFSGIRLYPADFHSAVRTFVPGTAATVAFCGTLAQLYKGLDVLIQSVRLLVDRGVSLTVEVAGDGKFRPQLEQLVADLGVADRFRFRGFLERTEVMALLDRADLFVLPSRTEGLPRALIEAMAKALPCIASHVGGVPELLDAGAMVPPGNPAALADSLARVLGDARVYGDQSRRNLLRAQDFSAAKMEARATEFLTSVRQRAFAAATADRA